MDWQKIITLKSLIMKSKQFFFCFWSIFGVLGLNGVAEAKESRDIAKQVFPSVVMLITEDNSGRTLSLASGFFVRDNIVATNLHVVEGATGGYAKIVGKKQKYDIVGYVAIDNKMDLVLLKVNDVNAPAIALGDSSKVAIGDEIFAVGNPKGLDGTFSKGIISAMREIEEDSLLQITAPISPGSSGGPVLNNEAEVIGISVATFKGGQNLNFAIPSSYVSKLLSDVKPVKKLTTQEKPEKKAKSILADLGSHNAEGVTGGQFLWKWGAGVAPAGIYSFSLRNELKVPIRNIICLVIFYDNEGKPIEVDPVVYEDIVPPGLARRATSTVSESIETLTTNRLSQKPNTRVEFRILDFEIMDE